MSEAMNKSGPLFVSKPNPKYLGNFWVENNTDGLDSECDENYVSFSGYFGSYGPYVFAAAPELLEALKAQDQIFKQGLFYCPPEEIERANTMRKAAIAKAEGRSDPTSGGRVSV